MKVHAGRDAGGELVVVVEGPDYLEAEGGWEDLRRTYEEVLPEIAKSINAGEH